MNECNNMGESSNPCWAKEAWHKIEPYESVHQTSKNRQNHLQWYKSESVCLGCVEGLLQKQGVRVSRAHIHYPLSGGGYIGVYSNICTSLRFKPHPSNYLKSGINSGT